MPSCPSTCPVVKRQLRRQAAERQKALQAGPSSSDQNEEEETPQDKIPDEEPSPADSDFGKIAKSFSNETRIIEEKELESDHDSQENERRAEDEVRRIEDDASNEENISRSVRSGGSERRSLRHSVDDLSGRSSRSRNGDGSREKSGSKSDGRRKSRDRSVGSEKSGSKSDGRRKSRDKSIGSEKSGSKSDGRRNFRDESIGSEKSRGKSEQTRISDHSEYESDQSEQCDPTQDNPCSSECSSRLKEKKKRRKLAKRKATNGGMNYFSDLCNCCLTCLFNQLWNDPFTRKMFRSAALFAMGIKLCWEMDAWYIPTPSII